MVISGAPAWHPLADLDGVLGDHAVDRRADDGALEVEPGLVEPGALAAATSGLSATRRRRSGRRRRAAGRRPPRLASPGRRRPGPRHGGLGVVEAVLGGGQLLARDRAGGGQRLAAVRSVRARARSASALAQLGARRAMSAPWRPWSAVWASVVGEVALHLALGLRQVGLGRGHGQAVVGGVDHHQHIALLHRLGVGHRRGDDRAADQRRHLGDVGLDIGVVGLDVVRARPAASRAPQATAAASTHAQDAEQADASACAAVAALRRGGPRRPAPSAAARWAGRASVVERPWRWASWDVTQAP